MLTGQSLKLESIHKLKLNYEARASTSLVLGRLRNSVSHHVSLFQSSPTQANVQNLVENRMIL